MLARLVDEGFAANRHVHYPRNHGRVAVAVTFRAEASAAAAVRVPGLGVRRGHGRGSADRGGRRRRVPGPAAAVRGSGGPVRGRRRRRRGAGDRASRSTRRSTRWVASVEGGAWEPVRPRVGGDRPPHLDPVGSVDVVARRRSRARCSTSARRCSDGPSSRPARGRSSRAARARRRRLPTGPTHETRHDLVELPGGGWTTRHRLGFRYLAVRSDVAPDEVAVQASVPAVDRPGAFACSDDRLTRIWASAQYTLRLCMQGLMIDGIKRDRMPWAGDQALSTLANAFAVGDGGIVADGLVALGRPDHGYVNGISDYSLWWVVNAGLHLRYFGDAPFARLEQERLNAFVEDLARHAGHDGVFRPPSQRGGFVDSGPGSVFIDWGLSLEHGRDSVALQMLWYWALRSAERVLARTGHPGAPRWGALASRLEATLRERAWLPRARAMGRLPRRPAVEASGDLCELPRRHGRHARAGAAGRARRRAGGYVGNAVHDRVPAPRADRRGRAGSRRRRGASHLGGHARRADRAPSGRRARSRATRSRCTGARSVGVVATRGRRVRRPSFPRRCSGSDRSMTAGRDSRCGPSSATWSGPPPWCRPRSATSSSSQTARGSACRCPPARCWCAMANRSRGRPSWSGRRGRANGPRSAACNRPLSAAGGRLAPCCSTSS